MGIGPKILGDSHPPLEFIMLYCKINKNQTFPTTRKRFLTKIGLTQIQLRFTEIYMYRNYVTNQLTLAPILKQFLTKIYQPQTQLEFSEIQKLRNYSLKHRILPKN